MGLPASRVAVLTDTWLWLSEAVRLPREFELEIPVLEQAVPVRLPWSEAKTHSVMVVENSALLPTMTA